MLYRPRFGNFLATGIQLFSASTETRVIFIEKQPDPHARVNLPAYNKRRSSASGKSSTRGRSALSIMDSRAGREAVVTLLQSAGNHVIGLLAFAGMDDHEVYL